MADKPQLPIERIAEHEFRAFKEDFLDTRGMLDDSAISRIRQLFGICDDSVIRACDEAHSHSYFCIEYRHPAAAIVDRMAQDILRYQKTLAQIESKIVDTLR